MTVSYSPTWERRALQQRVLPMLRGVARRWVPQLEEFSVDIAPGRALVMPPPSFCAFCWGQKRIWEPVEDGSLLPVLCVSCEGRGWT